MAEPIATATTIVCDLWFAEMSPFGRVHICQIEVPEWDAFAAWASHSRLAFPVRLPIQLEAVGRVVLKDAVDGIDWDELPIEAIGCVAMFSELLRQAESQQAGVIIERR